jgi:DinB family protein
MSERARHLAQQFEQANHALIATVDRLSDDQWRAKTPGDGRSVGVVAHHVAEGHKGIAGLAGAIAHGQPVPPLTMDMIHRGNATHAVQHAHCTKAETLALLRQNGAAAAATVRGLGEAELDRAATLPLGTMSASQVIERILIGHVHDHHGSIQKAIGE